jgi:hypothetical protein
VVVKPEELLIGLTIDRHPMSLVFSIVHDLHLAQRHHLDPSLEKAPRRRRGASEEIAEGAGRRKGNRPDSVISSYIPDS